MTACKIVKLFAIFFTKSTQRGHSIVDTTDSLERMLNCLWRDPCHCNHAVHGEATHKLKYCTTYSTYKVATDTVNGCIHILVTVLINTFSIFVSFVVQLACITNSNISVLFLKSKPSFCYHYQYSHSTCNIKEDKRSVAQFTNFT